MVGLCTWGVWVMDDGLTKVGETRRTVRSEGVSIE